MSLIITFTPWKEHGKILIMIIACSARLFLSSWITKPREHRRLVSWPTRFPIGTRVFPSLLLPTSHTREGTPKWITVLSNTFTVNSSNTRMTQRQWVGISNKQQFPPVLCLWGSSWAPILRLKFLVLSSRVETLHLFSLEKLSQTQKFDPKAWITSTFDCVVSAHSLFIA